MIRFRLGADDRAALDLDDGWMEFDETTLRVTEHRAVKRETGLSLQDIANGLKVGNLDATAGLVWLTLYRTGRRIGWNDLDFDLLAMEWEPEGKASPATTTSPG